MTRKERSSVDRPSSSKDPTTAVARRGRGEVRGAKRVVIRPVGYPFRLRGEPQSTEIEVDNVELFQDYVREQWIGSVVKPGMHLFDRYIMPDFAFRVVEVIPQEAMITKDTQIILSDTITVERTPAIRKVSLDDVIGHDKVKGKCRVVLEYLKNPSHFAEWSPRTILFYGPPGTGKTMTALALAQEAHANFVLARGPDLIGAHVGEGGRRISAVFERARQSPPSIIFIDELDAVALTRAYQSVRGDVSEIVTALLSEIDKIDDESQVVVIGATNAIEMLDPAIKSRFDAAFEFKLPTERERLAILRKYTASLPIPVTADLRIIASRTSGLSGRDLRNRVLKEALHIAMLEEREEISHEVLMRVVQNLDCDKRPVYTV